MAGTAARFSWRQAPDLMARLTAAQNHPANMAQDIMTFAGFCATRAELEAHVVRYETIAANWGAPPKRGRRAA